MLLNSYGRKSKVEVLIYSPSLINVSGGARVILNWISAAIDMEWKVKVLTPDGLAPLWAPTNSFTTAPWDITPHSADLVIATVWWTAWECQKWQKKGIPTFHLVQEDEMLWAQSPQRRRVIKAAFHIIKTKVCVSRWVAGRVAAESDSVYVIPPPVSIPVAGARLNWGNPLVIGLSFRKELAKGWAITDNAVKAIKNTGAKFEYVAWGPGARSALQKSYKWILEPLRDIELIKIYDSCDIFLHTSWYEGFGLPPLEAMSRGAVVVVTRSGGVSEYAIHESNCLMADPGDVRGLKSCIERLAESPSLRETLSKKAVETAKFFNVDSFKYKAKKILSLVIS